PGNLRTGRSARRGQSDLCTHVEEPFGWREPVQRRSHFQKAKTIRRARPPGRRCGSGGNGVLGSRRKTLGGALLANTGRKVARQDSALRRHHEQSRPERNGSTIERTARARL